MSKHILVTGGSGFIGSNFVRMLLRDFDGDGSYDAAASGIHPAIATNLASARPRGDGNGDGNITAADFTSLARALRPARTIAAERTASVALDGNGDGGVNSQDARAMATRCFGG